MHRDGITRPAATSKAAKNHPMLRAAYVMEHNMPRLQSWDREQARRAARIKQASK